MSLNLGVVVILISALGFISNWLNWRFLNFKIVHLLYYIGAFVHEFSHAIMCLFMGAKILEFKVFNKQPQVVHEKSKIPIVGGLLISFAPMAGGMLFLFLMNKFALSEAFIIPQFTAWQNLFADVIKLLSQIHISEWQSWVMILLFLNVGAMIGPSPKDLKNIWPILIILLFIKSAFFIHLGLLAVLLILANIAIQVLLMLVIKVLKLVF